MENKIAKFLCDSSLMQEIYTIEKGPTIVGAWGKDAGTMERRLKLAFVYPDGEVSPIKEYSPSKLSDKKALKDLADLDGVSPELITGIYSAVRKKMETLAVQTDSGGKYSLCETYRTLCEYVEQYEEPGRFVRDGYGNILASYLQTVLDKLELGYTRLELQKNFKAWGLLRTNQGTGHVYSYKINTGSANDWYFSFKLQEGSEAA